MSELLTQWSSIMAFLGDEGSRDGFENIDYSSAPSLTPSQLMAVNEKLVELVESLGKHPDQKDELLEMMRGFDSGATGMQGGKRKRRRRNKTRRNRSS